MWVSSSQVFFTSILGGGKKNILFHYDSQHFVFNRAKKSEGGGPHLIPS